ncbi:hypothetical protein Ancab_038080 [Ancistrocladus abbreviatus]
MLLSYYELGPDDPPYPAKFYDFLELRTSMHQAVLQVFMFLVMMNDTVQLAIGAALRHYRYFTECVQPHLVSGASSITHLLDWLVRVGTISGWGVRNSLCGAIFVCFPTAIHLAVVDSLIASRWTVLHDALGSRRALRRLLCYGTNVRAALSIWKIVLVQGASGVVASATASCITTPLDTVKNRLQGIDGYLEHELELSAFEDQVTRHV